MAETQRQGRETTVGATAHVAHAQAAREDAPPKGSFRAAWTTDGGFFVVLNAADVKAWTQPTETASRVVLRAMFVGISDKVIDEALAALALQLRERQPAALDEAYEVDLAPAVVQQVTTWMTAHHPEMAVARPSDAKSGGDRSRKAGATAHTGKPAPLGGARRDEARAAALFARMQRLAANDPVFHAGVETYPEFLAFAADHAAELAALPATAHEIDSLERSIVTDWIDRFRDHVNALTGDRAGWAKWNPVGTIELHPRLAKYVAGSKLHASVEWDLSVHPQAYQVLIGYHCTYAWTIDGKAPVLWGRDALGDVRGDPQDTRQVVIDLVATPHPQALALEARSPHFHDGKFTALTRIEVVSEAAFDREAFEQAHVTGENATFERDKFGKLHARSDASAPTAETELMNLALRDASIKLAASEGKLDAEDERLLEDHDADARRELHAIEREHANQKPYIVRGTVVGREDSSTTELKVMMYVVENSVDAHGRATFSVVLHDETAGFARHPGTASQLVGKERKDTVLRLLEVEALEAMADHFHAHNDLPNGTAHLAVQLQHRDVAWEKTFDTDNGRKTAKRSLNMAAMLGAPLAMLVPGGPIAVGVVFVSQAATVASILIDIEDRVAKEGHLAFDRRLLLDALVYASTALGFASMPMFLDTMTPVAKTALMLVHLGVDAAQMAVMAVDVIEQLELVQANAKHALGAAGLTDEAREAILEERDDQVAAILAVASANGSFMIISTAQGATRVVDTLGRERYQVRREVSDFATNATHEQIHEVVANRKIGNLELKENELEFLRAITVAPDDTFETFKRNYQKRNPTSRKSTEELRKEWEAKRVINTETGRTNTAEPQGKGNFDTRKQTMATNEEQRRADVAADPRHKDAGADAGVFEDEVSARRDLTPTDKSVLRRWSRLIAKLASLGMVVDDARVGELLEGIGPNFGESAYRTFRQRVRKMTVDFIRGSQEAAAPTRSNKEQVTLLREILSSAGDLDNRTEGDLNQAYRERRFGGEHGEDGIRASTPEGYEFDNPKDVVLTDRTHRDGDGVVTITTNDGLPPSMKTGQRYVVDDKAGGSVNSKQLTDVDKLIKSEGDGITMGGIKYEGVIFMCTDEATAGFISDQLVDKSDRIHVSFYDSDGALRWKR